MWTVDPGATRVPAGGPWVSTSPGLTQALEEETLGTRPSPLIVLIALLWGSETRLGRYTPPVDTVKFTGDPGNSMMPAAGLCERTIPAGAALRAEDTAPTV